MQPTTTQHFTQITFSIITLTLITRLITHKDDSPTHLILLLCCWSTTRIISDGIQSTSHLLQKFWNTNKPNPPPTP